MNILMINYEYSPLGGGGGVFNKQLAEALAERNAITVVTTRFGDQKKREIVNGVELMRVLVPLRRDCNEASLTSMLGFFPSSLWAGMKLLQRRHFDIIHSMFAIPSAPSAQLLATLYKKPHILSILGGDIYDPSKCLSPHQTPMLHQTVQQVLNAADCVVSLSTDIQRRARSFYRVNRPIDVIHLGIPKPGFEPAQRKAYGLGEEDIVLITVGRLVARKCVGTLIDILHDLADSRVKLLVIGDGPEKEKLVKLGDDLELNNHLFFMSNVSDKEKFALLNLSDIYVSASSHEGFGIVFLEAMSAGLPVACFDNGGQSDFLTDGQTGALVPYGRQDLLTAGIQRLMNDMDHRQRISAFNSRYINQFYIETCARRYEAHYQELCQLPDRSIKTA